MFLNNGAAERNYEKSAAIRLFYIKKMNKKDINKTVDRETDNLQTAESLREKERLILDLMHSRFSAIQETLGDQAAQLYIDTVENEMQKHYQPRSTVEDTELVSDLVQ